jgi:hypothetical protein
MGQLTKEQFKAQFKINDNSILMLCLDDLYEMYKDNLIDNSSILKQKGIIKND